MKKKNIIWLCANIAVFALFAFFHSVKFVAAAAVVYSAASIGLLTFDMCRGRTESIWCAPMVPVALMIFETEINNAIDSFGPMLCVSIIIAIVLTIVAYMQEEVCGLFRRRSEAGAVHSARRAFYNGLRHDAQQYVHTRRT